MSYIFNLLIRYVELLREKEKRILHMGDEISRLAMYESESERKDRLILELRERIKQTEHQLHVCCFGHCHKHVFNALII